MRSGQIGLRVRFHNLLHYHVQIRACLLDCDSGLQSRHLIEIMNSAPLRRIVSGLEWMLWYREPDARSDPQFGLRRKLEIRRHHSGDGESFAIERDRGADDVLSAAETTLPKRVTQDGLSAACRGLRPSEKAMAEKRRYA